MSMSDNALCVYGSIVTIARIAIIGLGLTVARAYEAHGQGQIRTGHTAAGQPAAAVYEVVIEGLDDEPRLKKLLEDISQLRALQERPPETNAGLRNRAKADLGRFATALRSEGFYGHELGHRVERQDDALTVIVTVAPGPVYLLAEYVVEYTPAQAPISLSTAELERLALHAGMAARAEAITEARNRLLRDLKNGGYALARLEDLVVMVDNAMTTVTVHVKIDAGPGARFGEVRFEGLVTVKKDHLRRRLPWAVGDLYDESKVEVLRARLLDTGLFSSVEMSHDDSLPEDGLLPVTITVVEAKHRSIGGGISYSSAEGFGANAFWEHRNFFGRQETVALRAKAGELQQGLSALLRKPDILRLDQDLLASAAARLSQTEAFDERTIEGRIGLDTRLDPRWRVSDTLSSELTTLEDNEGERTFALFGYTAAITRDTTDSILDPTRGSRLRLAATPYIGTLDHQLFFGVGEVTGSVYVALDSDARWVVAGRGRLGSIVGEATEILPASKRFYAGGGASIRGFDFQKVGPLDADNDPIGGRSVIEVGLELRARLTDKIGLALFADGGNVYDHSYPDFDDELRWALGVGFRYFTVIGPLRLDVAFPVNPRSDVDNVFEFYVSLGQAF